MTKAEIEKIIDICTNSLFDTSRSHITAQISKSYVKEAAEKSGLLTGTCESCKHDRKDMFSNEICDTCSLNYYSNWQGVE